MKKNHIILKTAQLYVDRNSFLRKTFPQAYGSRTGNSPLPAPKQMGISTAELHQKAMGIIRNYTLRTSFISAGLGIPGGAMIPVTVSTDLYQYYGQLLIVAQKISYLYGLNDLSQADDETQFQILSSMLWIMLGHGGKKAAANVLKSYMKPLQKYILKNPVSSNCLQRVIRFIVTRVGAQQLTKRGVMEVLKKALPIVSGAVSGTITWVTFKPACIRILAHFENQSANNY